MRSKIDHVEKTSLNLISNDKKFMTNLTSTDKNCSINFINFHQIYIIKKKKWIERKSNIKIFLFHYNGAMFVFFLILFIFVPKKKKKNHRKKTANFSAPNRYLKLKNS